MQLLNDANLDKIGIDAADENLEEDDELVSDTQIDEKNFIKKQQEKKQKKFESTITKSVKKQVDDKEAAEGFETWYACDGCFIAIDSGQYRFDC